MHRLLIGPSSSPMTLAAWRQVQTELRARRRALLPHASWPLCATCGGTGRENECWVHDPESGGGHPTGRVPVDLGGDAYRGFCRTCAGVGRTRPDGWEDPVFGPAGEVLAPGSHPELHAMFTRRAEIQHGGGVT